MDRFFTRQVPSLFACLIFFFNPVFANTDKEKNNERILELKALRLDIRILQDSLKDSQGKHSRIHKKLKISEEKISQLTQDLFLLKNKYKKTKVSLNKFRKIKLKKQALLISQMRKFEKQVQSAYTLGRQGKIKMLLDQKNPDDVSRALIFNNYLNKERIKQINFIRISLKDIESTKFKIENKKKDLEKIISKQNKNKSKLEKELNERKKIAKYLETKIYTDDQKLVKLINEEKQLNKLLSGLAETINEYKIKPQAWEKFSRVKGNLMWPTRGLIKHTFGETKIGGIRWDGVIIETDDGLSLKSIHPGRVVFAGWLKGFGLLVIIDHGDSFLSLYGHNKSILKNVGDFVEAGESIAIVGNTGGRKKSGVYFAIRENGKAIDPKYWCLKTNGRRID